MFVCDFMRLCVYPIWFLIYSTGWNKFIEICVYRMEKRYWNDWWSAWSWNPLHLLKYVVILWWIFNSFQPSNRFVCNWKDVHFSFCIHCEHHRPIKWIRVRANPNEIDDVEIVRLSLFSLLLSLAHNIYTLEMIHQ